MIIKNSQFLPFRSVAVQQFKAVMMQHVQEFFPNHFSILGDGPIVATIDIAFERAAIYGFTTKPEVCLYLNVMMIWGSYFDCDPQYTWAATILADPMPSGEKINKLSEISLDKFLSMSGRKQIYIRRLVRDWALPATAVKAKLEQWDLAILPEALQDIFRVKYFMLNADELMYLRNYSRKKSTRYNIIGDKNQLKFAVLMFLLGSDFDIDPKYQCCQDTLMNASMSEQEKMDYLLTMMLQMLRPLTMFFS